MTPLAAKRPTLPGLASFGMTLRVVIAGLLLGLVASCGGGASGGAKVSAAVVPRPPPITVQKFAATVDDAAGFGNVWKRAPRSAGELGKVTSASRKAESLGYRIPVASGTRTAANDFLRRYNESTADVVTLVGHNDNGLFRFADGSWVQLSTLGNPNRPMVAMVSCDSIEYANGQAIGLPSAVTYTIAYATENKFANRIAQLPWLPSKDVLQQMLIQSLDEAAREHQVAIKYRIAAGVGVSLTAPFGIAIYQEAV